MYYRHPLKGEYPVRLFSPLTRWDEVQDTELFPVEAVGNFAFAALSVSSATDAIHSADSALSFTALTVQGASEVVYSTDSTLSFTALTLASASEAIHSANSTLSFTALSVESAASVPEFVDADATLSFATLSVVSAASLPVVDSLVEVTASVTFNPTVTASVTLITRSVTASVTERPTVTATVTPVNVVTASLTLPSEVVCLL